ncbi:amidase [Amycolatopsis sp. FU40]|uniref:amidase n=1 Tax=Amycolatopsis sp. FU40 TaxID=2914159 RepID=UPI001F01B702|nr:amidase [Amycolatopsis sp. FU40]UKD59130.1 amidase [Amycolatopsis sp. FU40]
MSAEEICYLPARELARRLRVRELSAREVLQAHLDRIEQVNPQINAIVTLTAERALSEAAAADERLARGEEAGPLHGIPVAHKDTHDVAGVRTTYGSPIFADHVPGSDTLVVERIRNAGAITLGKTNAPEFGAGSHTMNPVFGATRNPYRRELSAGGSSGGAAAALAAGLQPLAEGSDMGGSLRNPASFCNVVGLRPSPGRVPTWPATLPWEALCVQGPMGRTVADVALLLSVIAGHDERNPISLDEPAAPFAGSLDADLAGLRVAWSPDLGGLPVDPAVSAVLEPAVQVFAELGCRVEPACPDLASADEVFRTLRGWLFHAGFSGLLEEHPGKMKQTLADNIAFGATLSGADIARAQTRQLELITGMREFFTQYDLLLAPVSQVPPFPVEWEYPETVAGQPMHDYLEWMRSAYSISATGCPALSVPAGFTGDGRPVGLQIIAPVRGELGLLRAAHAFEQATGYGNQRPVF